MATYDCDIAVIGAGVAGLAAATASSRAGARTILVDAAPEVAAKVKGEVIKQKNSIIQKILGRPIPHSMVNGISRRRRIVSPSAKKQVVLDREDEPSLMIEYRPLMLSIAKSCIEAGAQVLLNTRCDTLILDDDERVAGIKCRQSGTSFDLKARAIIAADGWNSPIRRQLNLQAPVICPAYKIIVEGAEIPDEEMLEFLLLNEPAGALWIFPKGKSSAECGITYWDDSPQTKQADLQAAWERLRHEHPVLKERLRNASPVLTSKDGLIFGGVLQEFVRPGLVLVGDAAGQVGAKGASGILSGLNMGYEAGNFLGLHVTQHKNPPDISIMQRCMDVMKDTDTWRMLLAEEKSGAMTRHFLFKVLQTNEEIDGAWDAISEMAK